jgi:hypothetical protein
VSSRLVNVRLDLERLREAQALREGRIALSDAVREAIDERCAALGRTGPPTDMKATVKRIFDRYPDPADLPAREYHVHDRRAARATVRRRLRRPHR